MTWQLETFKKNVPCFVPQYLNYHSVIIKGKWQFSYLLAQMIKKELTVIKQQHCHWITIYYRRVRLTAHNFGIYDGYQPLTLLLMSSMANVSAEHKMIFYTSQHLQISLRMKSFPYIRKLCICSIHDFFIISLILCGWYFVPLFSCSASIDNS